MTTTSQPDDIVGVPQVPSATAKARASENLSLEVASQWQLMWWKFRKHRLAIIGGIVVLTFYFVAIFADFFAPVSPSTYIGDYSYAPPQSVNLFHDGRFAPYVNGYRFERDPESFKKIWFIDESVIIPVGFFVRGEPYKLWGLFDLDIHFIGPITSGDAFYLMGADKTGHDVFSRIIHSSRVSLSVGLLGVAMSFTIGILLGGISGLVGGWLDNVVQRLIEVAMSVPNLPIIIAFAAVVPIDMPTIQVYFIITLLLALTGWTGLARVVRSKFLALREEDFVLAARLDGAKPTRLILRHMLPSFYSHIIASITLALPGMIIAETALSFLGVGLRPPVVSWGVQLQEATKINVVATYPWLMLPAFAVIIIVLAFNFLGDGLRDAADPY